jgi:hypothetical protein
MRNFTSVGDVIAQRVGTAKGQIKGTRYVSHRIAAIGSCLLISPERVMPVCRRRRPILATLSTINTRMRDLLAPQADALGLRLLKIEVRDLILPGELKRAFAQTITAQKEALASLERARGETASLRSLANAARIMQDHPGLLQLRAVQAIEASKGNTIALGLPDLGEQTRALKGRTE